MKTNAFHRSKISYSCCWLAAVRTKFLDLKLPNYYLMIWVTFFCEIWGGAVRPNPEGRIIENRKAEFDRKAENISSLISAQYINIFICCNNHLVYHDMLMGEQRLCSFYIFGRLIKFGLSVFYLFGRLVNYSAVRFYIYSAIRIRPYG